MASTQVTLSIAAAPEKVFDAVAHIERFQEIVPAIVHVKFLTDAHTGVGTRFRETRLMKGREVPTDLEVTEYVKNERVRIVSDTNGTIWDTVFTTSPQDGGTLLTMQMEARAYQLLPRLMNPLIMGMVRKFVASDMEAVKRHCEVADQ